MQASERLPAGGRTGRAPTWPLSSPPSRVETTIWAELWHTPMAVVWERIGWTHSLALLARLQALAEAGSLRAAQEARLLGDRWGLDPAALQRLGWEIADAEPSSGRRTPDRSLAVRRLRLTDLHVTDPTEGNAS